MKASVQWISWQARVLTRVLPHLVEARFGTRLDADPDVTVLRARTARLARPAAVASAALHPRVARLRDPALAGEWIRVASQADAVNAVIVYLHGGGFYVGSAATHRSVTIKLAVEAQLPVLSLDYRLAPEHPFPCALDDVLAAFHSLVARGIPPSSIILAGDSAGGNLALAAMIALRDAGGDLPAGAILFSPWLDLAVASWNSAASLPLSRAAMESAARMYVGAGNAEEPLVSPSRAELHNLPPMQIMVSDAESVFDDACRLVKRIRAVGGSADLAVWNGMPHAWPCFAPFLPEAGDALAHAAQFARQCIGVTTDLG